MDFQFLQKCIESINLSSSIQFHVGFSPNDGNLGFHSERKESEIQVGPSFESFLYLYLYGWKNVLYQYYAQNKCAENGLYSLANEIIGQLTRSLSSWKTVKMKFKFCKRPYLINDLTLLSLFHEFGHITFNHFPNIQSDYFDIVYKYAKDLPIDEVIKKIAAIGEFETSKMSTFYENSSIIEEVACDFFSIDLVLKLNKHIDLGKKRLLDLCFSMINLLTFHYEKTALDCYVENNEIKLITKKLPLFCFRRMLVFDRMRDVLFNEQEIDSEWFATKCEEINLDCDLILAKTICLSIYPYIRNKDINLLNQEKSEYLRNIELLNSNFRSNSILF